MVIFFDIDGTIVDDTTKIIPGSTIRAIEKLKENGHVPIINTGRPYLQIDHRVKAMAFRGFSCGCGMEVLLDGKYLIRAKPSLVLRKKCLNLSRKYHMISFYETEDGGILLDGKNSVHPVMSKEVERLRAHGYPIRELMPGMEPDFVKFVTFPSENSDCDSFKAELSRDFTIIDREGSMYELVLNGYSKAVGMQRILEHLNAMVEDSYAIGDSTNDLSMFRFAAHTICMGNGDEKVKQAVDYVTSSVLDDGIEKALKYFDLI